ncbi:Haloacid Dehalogenase Superfamily Class (subfamily) IIA [Nocardioides scoriae]|uniref:Haloacid Dehalogenase Superfamily Class (Subfamily) IIA n=1 Tax=Nocardioides scoriae TaxID=642780 RepID=A0A1H1PIR1_9ACTN|nr:HAD-IIA family hydrolase [Nocardioides scoriae]SDS11191.1 Haloacid Dehalogenase Superfamily Class (subfamily) IIA [Nocardioides scoriae]
MSLLGSSGTPLQEAYDVAVLDLDGVVYRGRDAVPGAPEALNAAQAQGMHLAFVTNNASRPPSTVGDHLRSLGVEASDDDVVNSAQAAARLASQQLDQGAKVFLVGGQGLDEALRERGLVPVSSVDEEPVAVVQGYGPDLAWKQIMAGATLVADGLPWIASNTDMTIPTASGAAPGNGALVKLIADFAAREPQVAGKPQPPLFEETLARVGGEHPLVVGDRLDTDIEGAVTMGWDSLLVLTGVTGLEELVAAGPECRPTYVAPDLAALAAPQPAPEVPEDGTATLGGWSARVEEGTLRVSGDGEPADWWRVVAEVSWRHLDEHGGPVATDGVDLPG